MIAEEGFLINPWLSGEALQIAVKRREAKSKEEKERYTHLNAEFQRIAKRDKKAFLNDHCKEIEENTRMGKTRDLFKKIRDPKGTFHAKMGSIKDRNGRDLRSRRYYEEVTRIHRRTVQKISSNPDNHDQLARTRHPGRRTQVGLRKHHYEQS